jgi:hypothetical protein
VIGMVNIIDANEGCDIFIDEQVGFLLYHIPNIIGVVFIVRLPVTSRLLFLA